MLYACHAHNNIVKAEGTPYGELFSYGRNFRIFRTVEHHPKIITIRNYCTAIYIQSNYPVFNWAVHTKIIPYTVYINMQEKYA